ALGGLVVKTHCRSRGGEPARHSSSRAIHVFFNAVQEPARASRRCDFITETRRYLSGCKKPSIVLGGSLRNRSRVRYHLLRVSQGYRGPEGFKGAANLGGIRGLYQEYGVGGRQEW